MRESTPDSARLPTPNPDNACTFREGARGNNRRFHPRRSSRSTWVLFCAVACFLLAACGGGLAPDVTRKSEVAVTELATAPDALALPKRDGSVRFAVIGDGGRGDQAQYDVAKTMAAWRERFPFDFVIMLGDNIYDRHTPEDYAAKFERPYAPLLDAGVTFFAAIGNHDDPGQLHYRHFNMGGHRYYSFRRAERTIPGGLTGAGVRFFVLDSRSFDSAQLEWLRKELEASGSRWKIVYFHHPLYTSGRYASASRALRAVVEPILIDGDVDVVLSGHEHFYERLVPQHGIVYFISGAGGALRPNDIRPSQLTARGFDTDNSFMLMEVAGDELYFQAIDRKGRTVDSGKIQKR